MYLQAYQVREWGQRGDLSQLTLPYHRHMLLSLQGPNYLPYAPGGGIENMGIARAVNEMLLGSAVWQGSAPGAYTLELFPFWPEAEPAAFETLLAKGGFAVSAVYDANAGVVAPGVVVTAAYTLQSSPSAAARLVSDAVNVRARRRSSLCMSSLPSPSFVLSYCDRPAGEPLGRV
jgi:hypothetical protein